MSDNWWSNIQGDTVSFSQNDPWPLNPPMVPDNATDKTGTAGDGPKDVEELGKNPPDNEAPATPDDGPKESSVEEK
jgi:hypothetical protein